MNLSARQVITPGLMVVLGLVGLWPASEAYAQGMNHGDESASADPLTLAVGVAHGATLGAAVFLAGLVAFASLVWLPASRTAASDQEKAANLFCRWMWMLVVLLAIAGMVEIPLYAVRASGETLSPGLLVEALFITRVGQLWIARLALGVLIAVAATYAAGRLQRPAYWWAPAIIAAVMLFTVTQQSHAAAEGSLLAFASDWLHLVAASVWMGALLGFPILLIGLLRTMPTETRVEMLVRTVRRFSKVATVAVLILTATGLYAILIHVPNLPTLTDTPYGRALIMKLGLMVLLLAAGGINLIDRGRGPFDRMVGAELILALGIFIATGFLTSLPPAEAEQLAIEKSEAAEVENASQPASALRKPLAPDSP